MGGYQAYQGQELWPLARAILTDYWAMQDFPLPGADEKVDCPIVAFHGADDAFVTLDMVKQWRVLSSSPSQFTVIQMDGAHQWFAKNTQRCEALGEELTRL